MEHQRPLPWRAPDPVRGAGYRDAYRSLVSEFMLQQTQVSRVLEKFSGFLERFPTVQDLARAGEDEVMAAWTGLGYYRRARLLHGAARAIVERHGGLVPETVEDLEALPGVGRYTAGAVASMAHGGCAALVDTNVVRVLLRVEGKDLPAKDAAAWVWERAGTLAAAAHRAKGTSAGVFNEGVMELGAVVCVSGVPRCGVCPLASRGRSLCTARSRGVEATIPRVVAKKSRVPVTHVMVVVRDRAGRVLLEQRPRKGLWGGLWQPPTLEVAAGRRVPGGDAAVRQLGLGGVRSLKPREGFVFRTTHRELTFVVWECVSRVAGAQQSGGREWVGPDAFGAYGMSSPVRRALGIV